MLLPVPALPVPADWLPLPVAAAVGVVGLLVLPAAVLLPALPFDALPSFDVLLPFEALLPAAGLLPGSLGWTL